MRTALRIELRRGVGALIFAVVTVVALGVYFKQVSGATTEWTSVVSGLTRANIVTTPLIIAIAATGGVLSNRRERYWLRPMSQRSRAWSEQVALAAIVLWLLASVVVVYVVGSAHAIASATWGLPAVTRLGVACVGMVCVAVVGFVVGLVLPFLLTPPTLACGLFALTTLFGQSSASETLFAFWPASYISWDFYNQIDNSFALRQMVWFAVVAATAIMLRLAFTRRTSGTGLLAATVVVATALTGVWIATNSVSVITPRLNITFSCRAEPAFRLCVHPALMQARPELANEFQPIVRELAGTKFAVTLAQQRPRGVGSRPSPGAVAFGLDSTSQTDIREATLEIAHNAVGTVDTCYGENGQLRPGATSTGPLFMGAVGDRIAALKATSRTAEIERARDNPDLVAALRFLSISAAEFRPWLDAHTHALQTCSLRAGDMTPHT